MNKILIKFKFVKMLLLLVAIMSPLFLASCDGGESYAISYYVKIASSEGNFVQNPVAWLDMDFSKGEENFTFKKSNKPYTLASVVDKIGYYFDGWYNNAECIGEKLTKLPANTEGNVRVYGKYKCIEYEINYDLSCNDAVLPSGTATKCTVEDMNGVVILYPTRPNHTLYGLNWSIVFVDSKGKTEKVSESINLEENPNQYIFKIRDEMMPNKEVRSVTITAIWRANS